MGNLVENLKKYFEETPKEKQLADWDSLKHLDNVGPTVEEFLQNTHSVEKIMVLHCPKDGGEVLYWKDKDKFVCSTCEWSGLYYETIKPYEQNVKKPQ